LTVVDTKAFYRNLFPSSGNFNNSKFKTFPEDGKQFVETFEKFPEGGRKNFNGNPYFYKLSIVGACIQFFLKVDFFPHCW
jgi:hypothetical protein